MFTIELLPAEFGDAIWIEYGKGGASHRILIDCGTNAVYPAVRQRILALPPAQRHLELFVVTHVDVDHIGGALALLRDCERLGLTIGDIWFNGYVHLTPGGVVPLPEDDDILGALQGEALTDLIMAHDPKKWNAAVGGRALVVPDTGPLAPLPALPGGMKLTLLSPTQRHLDRLRPVWEATCKKAGIIPGAVTAAESSLLEEEGEPDEDDDILGDPNVDQLAATPFKSDQAKPNASSIALLAEYDKQRVLLAGDALVPVLMDALARVRGKVRASLPLAAVKVSHHGSRSNTSLDLVKAVKCAHWLVSSNGKQFKHPNREAIARVIKAGGADVSLHFNYRTEFNDPWDSVSLRRKHQYKTKYPASEGAGIRLELAK